VFERNLNVAAHHLSSQVRERQRPDLLGCPPEVASHSAHDLQSNVRDILEQPQERIAEYPQHLGAFQGKHGRRPRKSIQQGQLAQLLEWTELADDRLAAAISVEKFEPEASRQDDQQAVAGVTLVEDIASLFVPALVGPFLEERQLGGCEVGEPWHAPQHCHPVH